MRTAIINKDKHQHMLNQIELSRFFYSDTQENKVIFESQDKKNIPFTNKAEDALY